MERFGSELIFISIIFGDGKTIEIIENGTTKRYSDDEIYKLNILSISNRTFIASGMRSYVVKLKNPPRE